MDKAENAKKLQDEQQDRINTDNKALISNDQNKNDNDNPGKIVANLYKNVDNNQSVNPNKKKAIQTHKQAVNSKYNNASKNNKDKKKEENKKDEVDLSSLNEFEKKM